jgi:hypothetical protein
VTAGNVQLLAERLAGGASHFAPYVRSLPVGVEGLPMFFSASAMKALEQYPPVSVQVHSVTVLADVLTIICHCHSRHTSALMPGVLQLGAAQLFERQNAGLAQVQMASQLRCKGARRDRRSPCGC